MTHYLFFNNNLLPNLKQTLIQSLAYINEVYSGIVDIDLSKFFDEVAHYKILQLIYER